MTSEREAGTPLTPPPTPRVGDDGRGGIVERGGRLNVEIRVLAFVALCWLMLITQATTMGWLLASREQWERVPWSLVALMQVAALLVVLGAVFVRFPVLRWARHDSLAHLPSPVPLAIAGAPALLLLPLLSIRDRRARPLEARSPEDVELTFRQLLVLPRTASLSFLTWVGAAFVVDAVLLAELAHWPRVLLLPLTGVWLALLAPYAVVIGSRGRAILRPEYLSAPRARNVSVASVTDLRVRLTVPAIAGVLAAVAAPLLVGWIASENAARSESLEHAQGLASELVARARDRDAEAAGRFLAAHGELSLIKQGDVYGRALDRVPNLVTGPLDADADGSPEAWVHAGRGAAAVVALAPTERMPKSLLLLAFVTLALGGGAAIVLISRDVARDVTRATSQVSAVAAGEVPPPLTEGSFSTRELRQLVQSVDRLVTRITETNVAKYVAIEKAQEADRLKSQFLANMSHDLRSPLNSIIGFSELLITGIEGEISPEQRAMIEIIFASGRELLQQIDDILDTAKIEAGRMELHPEPTPPATLVSRAIQNARRRQDKPIEYRTEIAPGLPPAFVDPYRTTQAIENVVVFAAELLAEGTIAIKVRPGSHGRGRMIFVRVETPTPPATEQHLTEVLRGFYRIPGHRGLGLGLPIAGSILELQGGVLGIEETGEGMAFNLQRPAPEARVKVRLRDR